MKLSILASGQGSNLKALARAIDEGRCHATIAGVISDRPEAPALSFAGARGIPTIVVPPKAFGTRPLWDAALADAIDRLTPDLVVLAGFMKIVGPAVLARYGGNIVNVHPSLLPAFPGLDAPAQALSKGVTVSGCTVHLVDAGVDTGPILAQAALPVRADDDAERLHERIQRAEHALLPAVIHAIATGALTLGERPRYREDPAVDTFCEAWPPLIV